MKYCNIFYCDIVGDWLCCTTCNYSAACLDRCLNDPGRCRLEDVRRRTDEKEGGHEAKEKKL